MGLFGVDHNETKNYSYDNRTLGSESATVANNGSSAVRSTTVVTKTQANSQTPTATASGEKSKAVSGSGILSQDGSTSVSLANAKVGDVTFGVPGNVLTDLVGQLSSAGSQQIQALSQNSSDQLNAFKDLLGQKTDTTAGNPKTLAVVAVAAILGFVLIFSPILKRLFR